MQTSVETYQKQWTEGQVTRGDKRRDWTVYNESVGSVKVGYTVLKGTDPRRQAILPAAAFGFGDFSGIAIHAIGISEKALGTGALNIVTDQGFTTIREGYVAVKLGATVAAGDYVFVVHTTGGATALYGYRKDLDTDKASKIPAIYMQGGVSGDIVEIYVNDAMAIGVS